MNLYYYLEQKERDNKSMENVLKNNYMKLDDACEEDWEEGCKDAMHQTILTSMSEWAAIVSEEKDAIIENLNRYILHLQLRENR